MLLGEQRRALKRAASSANKQSARTRIMDGIL
jgi:hypothetical protein